MTIWLQLISGVIVVLFFTQGKGENVTNWAKLYPDVRIKAGELCKAENAIDGRTNIGESGKHTVLNCASTNDLWPNRRQRSLQYLQIDLQRPYSIAAVRLHLRDEEHRQEWQNGLFVKVSNSTLQRAAGTRCGVAYDATRFGQSPLFTCWTSGRYVYAILKNTLYPLQVCEMQIFKVMDFSAPGVATIYPDDVYENEGKMAVAGNALDGLSSIGNSNASGGQNCAGLNLLRGKPRQVQYLHVDLGHSQQIYAIRLHLRDNKRYMFQKGMVVSVSNSSYISLLFNRDCGSAYNPITDGQSPVFVCNSYALHVWMMLLHHKMPLFICEVEVYADIRCLNPINPLNGNYSVTRLTHGGSLSVSCEKGFHPSSSDPVICEMSGNWSRPLPTCKAFCVRPPNVVNGRLVGIGKNEKIDVGASVLYTCNKGYVLVGLANRSRTCLPNRKWSETAPFCFDMSCSTCHKDADCLVGVTAYCRCKPEFVGDGKFCCPKDMRGEVAITGATVLFRCDRSCNVSFRNVTWLKNGSPLDISGTRYGLARNGLLLYIEEVTTGDSGEYACKLQVGKTVYQRYGSLEVMDTHGRNSLACSLDCGRSCSRKPLIAGGTLTYAGQFPWQAMLCSPPVGQYCGGVLVSPDCIVTAAHCLFRGGVRIPKISVCLGRQCGNCSELDPEGKPHCFTPQSFEVHPQFDRGTLDNDVAVMKIRHSPSLDCTSVYPVCLPNKTRDEEYIRAHKEGIVTGWGRVNATVSRSRCLRKGYVNLASRRICDLRHDKYPITRSMMCATDYNGACEGDSGGPMVVRNREYGDRYVLAGIVSWGIGCGKAKKLGVYTSVLSHLEWIKNTCAIQG